MKNIEENIILTNFDIEKKIERISLQILESNSEEKKIIFFGISDNGILIAKKIINLINKNEISLEEALSKSANKNIINSFFKT